MNADAAKLMSEEAMLMEEFELARTYRMALMQCHLPPFPRKFLAMQRPGRVMREGQRKQAAHKMEITFSLGYRLLMPVAFVGEERVKVCLGTLQRGYVCAIGPELDEDERGIVRGLQEELWTTPVRTPMNWSCWKPNVAALLESVPQKSIMPFNNIWTDIYGFLPPWATQRSIDVVEVPTVLHLNTPEEGGYQTCPSSEAEEEERAVGGQQESGVPVASSNSPDAVNSGGWEAEIGEECHTLDLADEDSAVGSKEDEQDQLTKARRIASVVVSLEEVKRNVTKRRLEDHC